MSAINVAKETLENKTLKAALLPVARYLVDGAISTGADVAVLTKATAGAYTLAAPTALQEGKQIRITSDTAAAHVVTATTLLEDGVTGGLKTTATFAAFKGASLSLIAIGLRWHVLGKNAVTIT